MDQVRAVDSTVKVKKKCLNCGKEFTTKQSLCRHKRNCGRTTLTSCHRCQKQFARLDSLKRHLISCIKAKPKLTKCDKCGKEFRNNWFLRRHLPCKGNLVCTKCNRSFRKPARFATHRDNCNGDLVFKGFGKTSLKREGNDDDLPSAEIVYDTASLEHTDPIPSDNDVSENDDDDDEEEINQEPELDRKIEVIEHSESDDLYTVNNETKVYILDDNLSFTDEEHVFLYPESLNTLDNVNKSIVSNEDRPVRNHPETSRLRKIRLAEQIANGIKKIFKDEGISDIETQLDVISLALQDLGLSQLTADLQSNTSLPMSKMGPDYMPYHKGLENSGLLK